MIIVKYQITPKVPLVLCETKHMNMKGFYILLNLLAPTPVGQNTASPEEYMQQSV